MDDLTLLAELNRDEPLAQPAELRAARDRLLAAATAESVPAVAHLRRRAHGSHSSPVTASPTTSGAWTSADEASHAGTTSHATGPATGSPTPPGAWTSAGEASNAGTASQAAAGTAADSGPVTGLAGAGPARRRWRLAAAAGLTASVAAGIAAVLVLGPTAPIAGKPPAARADAREVLHAAAVAAVRQPDLHPRPDQFVYLRTISSPPARTRQVWLSADGRRDGLVDDAGSDRFVLPGCPNGRAPDRDKQDRVIPEETHQCVAEPAYRTDLPDTADAMLAWLRRHASGNPGDINAIGKDVLDLAGAAYLPPRTLGALFEAASRLTGMQAIPDVVDGAGRHGVGVSWLRDGMRTTLIFDRNTHAFLGTSYTGMVDHGQNVMFGTALTRIAIVDRPGQRP